jgi:hypothetical protein
MHSISGAQLHLLDFLGDDKIQEQLRTHSTIKMTLQFERKRSTQGSGAPCHVSFGFFSGFYGIILEELQINPQLESMIRPKARGLHFIWNAILRVTFSIWFLLQNDTSIIENLQEENSRTLGNYSRRLQDYSRISWSTFQPRDASSIHEDFLACRARGRLRTTRQGHQHYSILLDYKVLGACRMDLPRPTTSVGTRTDYSVGPWDYSACATRHLLAWSARTMEEKYSDRKLCVSCTM